MPEEIIGHCWNCGQGLTKLDSGREATCLNCGKPVHCCRNCRDYALGRPNECREPLVERVVEKMRANFCEFFTPARQATGSATSAAAADPERLRVAAEDLFR